MVDQLSYFETDLFKKEDDQIDELVVSYVQFQCTVLSLLHKWVDD